ncbi:MAG: hypothetical protein O3B76_00500 [Proteobacteria bacterium]|nr:hypothetical protein [Pseudomonadota bacterium]MDA1023937.1 hypothetical protein [Pseudomonadota bacterium]
MTPSIAEPQFSPVLCGFSAIFWIRFEIKDHFFGNFSPAASGFPEKAHEKPDSGGNPRIGKFVFQAGAKGKRPDI